MSNLGFDVSEYETNVMEPGWQNLFIKDSAIDDNKNKDGKILKLTIAVKDGQYKDRQFFKNLNIFNKNPTAETIARAEVSAIAKAIGVKAQNHEDLRFKPFQGLLDVEKDEGYEAKNVIKGVGTGLSVKPFGEAIVEKVATGEEKAPW